jgi:hypothetical protein
MHVLPSKTICCKPKVLSRPREPSLTYMSCPMGVAADLALNSEQYGGNP